MPSRVQITLDNELQRRARRKAQSLGISFAEYVRRVVARDIGGAVKRPHVSAIFDLGPADEVTDIAREKEPMLAEAIEGHRRRK